MTILDKPARSPEVVRPKEAYEYQFIDTLSLDEADFWFGVYEEAFRELNEESPERQTMNSDEFRLAMTDPEVSKLCVLDADADSDIVGLTVYGSVGKSDIFSWLSQPYFQKHFPGAYEEGRVQYFVTTLVRPGMRDGGIMASMGQIVTERLLAKSEDTHVVFDCCEQNTFLPEALHGLASLTVSSAEKISPLQEIGTQKFYAFQMQR